MSSEKQVLLTGLSFPLNAASDLDVLIRNLPRRLNGISSLLCRLEVTIGTLQVPVGVFDVEQLVANGDFKIGDADIFVDASEDYRDAIDECSPASQQRMIDASLYDRRVVAGHGSAQSVGPRVLNSVF